MFSLKSKPAIVALLIGAFVATAPPSASALPRTSRQLSGVIQSVDPVARRFVIQSSDTPRQLALVWNDRTRFVKGSSFTAPTIVRAGQPVTVTYRSPLFTPAFATKVVARSESR